MAWDLEFKNGDLTGGIVTGDDEVIQRIRTRLFRELGEWFLNTASGLPWYQDGKGILGSPLRDKGAVDLFIRKQALGTEAQQFVCRRAARILHLYAGVARFGETGRANRDCP